MSALPSYGVFAEQLNSIFVAHTAAGEIELKLIEATELARGQRPAEFPTPLSLIFSSDSDTILGQDTYALDHPELGRLHLTLTPVISGKARPDYQAIIS